MMEDEHEHQYDPLNVELAMWTGTPSITCSLPGCRFVSLDLEGNLEDGGWALKVGSVGDTVLEVSDDELDFAVGWHEGLSSALYAVASTGALELGSRRPMEMVDGVWESVTDAEWRYGLLDNLRKELEDVLNYLDGLQYAHTVDGPSDAIDDTLADWDVAERFLDSVVEAIQNI